MNNDEFTTIDGQLAMTSLDASEISGMDHGYILRVIRKLMKTWFSFPSNRTKGEMRHKTIMTSNGAHRVIPYYVMNKASYQIFATTFKDETRAKLEQAWEQKEKEYNEASGYLNDKNNEQR